MSLLMGYLHKQVVGQNLTEAQLAALLHGESEGSNPTNNKTVRWQRGIPGNDLIAEGTGSSWGAGLHDADDKLRRQFVD